MMQEIKDAFWSRALKNEQLDRYQTPTLMLDIALLVGVRM